MKLATNNKKSEIKSFRLEKKLLDDLTKNAETEKISLNSLVTQIFFNHINWYANAPKAGLVPLPKSLLIKILEKLPDEEIKKIADYMAEIEVKSIIMMIAHEHTAQSFLEVVENWAKISNFPYSHVEKSDGEHQYIIQHDMGKKWAVYYERVFEKIFEKLEIKGIRFDNTDSTLIFNVKY